MLFQNYCFSKRISKLFPHSHNHALHWAMWGRAFINLAVECAEINDFRVKSHRVSQIHINNQTNSLRTRNCAMSKTHSLLLLLCLHNWTESIYDHSRDLRPVQQLGRLPLITTWCLYGFGSLFQTYASVCVVSFLTCLMLLMGSLIKCAAGVQLKRGIDKESPWLSAWVNWISTNPPHTEMLSIFSQ